MRKPLCQQSLRSYDFSIMAITKLDLWIINDRFDFFAL